jgi:hypothetical protein
MRKILAVMLAMGIVGCGGGGDSSSPEPSLPSLQSGQVDAAYGPGGHVVLGGGGASMAVASDGTVYVASLGTLVKLDPAGRRVTSFGAAAPEFLVNAYAPVLGEGGSVFFLRGAGIAKIDADGRADASFGTGGLALLEAGVALWSGLARDPAGGLYATRYAAFDGTAGARVAKADAQGRLDLGYGTNGVANAAASLSPGAIVVDATGAVYVAGALNTGNFMPAVVKLAPDGTRANDFGAGGLWTDSACILGESAVTAMAFDRDGSLLVGANCAGGPALYKLDANGGIVESFRDGGRRAGLFGASFGMIRAVSVGPGGAIYAAGFVLIGTCSDLAIAKLDSAGDPVASFGADGSADGVVTVHQGLTESFQTIGFDGIGRLYVGGSFLPVCPVTRPTSAGNIVYRFGP